MTTVETLNCLLQTKVVQCNICFINIPQPHFIHHTQNHFNMSEFSVEICKFCNDSINAENLESILEHMIYNHDMKSQCLMCNEQFETMDNLYFHLKDNFKIMYHCFNNNCQFITEEKKLLQKHLVEKKHEKRYNYREKIFYCKYGDINVKVDKQTILPKAKKRKLDDMSNSEMELEPQMMLRSDQCRSLKNSKYQSTIQYLLTDEDDDIDKQTSKRSTIQYLLKNKDDSAHHDNHIPSSKKMSKSLPSKQKVKRKLGEDSDYTPNKRVRNNSSNKSNVRQSLTNLKTEHVEPGSKKMYVFNYSEKLLYKFLTIANPPILEDFKTILNTLHDFPMSVFIENSKRTFRCETCGYASTHTHTDIRRHVLRLHCGISNKNIPLVMKFSRNDPEMKLLPDNELIRAINNDIAAEVLKADGYLTEDENIARELKTIKPKKSVKVTVVESGNIDVKTIKLEMVEKKNSKKVHHTFNYSQRVLHKLLNVTNPNVENEVNSTLVSLSNFPMIISCEGNAKIYSCGECNYSSVHSHTDIKRHILRVHCGVKNKDIQTVMKVSRSNTEMKLFSDSELINQINNDIILNTISAKGLLSDSEDESKEFCSTSVINKSYYRKDLELINKICLEYSKPILESICRIENCLKTLPDLEKKMAIYQAHTVHVYKRNGGILYMCSTCNWYSRVSIEDVIKHIMGYHVILDGQSKLVKKIVETSCKMDKNFKLLSDKEISDKGWKGRRILDHL